MDKQKTKIRNDFKKAYNTYLRDMEWLREKFGIIPEPKDSSLKKGFSASVNFALKDDRDSFQQTLDAFKEFHRSILYDVAWELLERSKENLKKIQKTEPELFNEKHQLWIQASWTFSEAIYKKKCSKFHDSIKISSRI